MIALAPTNLTLIADANEWINDAYSAMTVFRDRAASTATARDSLGRAASVLTSIAEAHADDEAGHAAQLVLPRIDRAQQLLTRIGLEPDDAHLRPLLSEFDAAMDHLEAILAGAGWD